MSPKTKADAYAAVTDRIIAALEEGVVPWEKPWVSVQGEWPTSLQTGKPYRGVNVWLLSIESMLKGYTSPYWVTFKQAKERGGNVKAGAKGTTVVLFKPVVKTTENDEGEEVEDRFWLLRNYTVFNLDQTEGIEMPEAEPLPERDPIEACEAIVNGFLFGPTISHGGNRACYSPSLDSVRMPKMGQFDSSESYYGTLFHELAHSTGHESRLNRAEMILPKPFGSEDYSKEELIAEMSAAMLSGIAGIEVPIERHAGYIQHWLKVLKDDKKLVVQAASKAQKASDLILGVTAEQLAAV
jgi:antirestriction protein ArdC